MNCMKCGKEIQDGQVFCTDCLEDMARYPVARDTYVQIPQRAAKPAEKKAKEVPLPDQIRGLKKWIHRLMAVIAILVIILAAAAMLLLQQSKQVRDSAPLGRNYTTSPRSFE